MAAKKAIKQFTEKVVWAWAPVTTEIEKAIIADLVRQGVDQRTFSTAPSEDDQWLLLQALVSVLHRSTARGGYNPWLDLSPTEQEVIRKEFGLDEQRQSTTTILSPNVLAASRMVWCLAATFARTTQKRVMLATPNQFISGIKESAYGVGSWVEEAKHFGLLVVECGSGDYFGQNYMAGSIAEIFHDRAKEGRGTVFTAQVTGAEYIESFQDQDIHALFKMLERGCSKNQPIIPFMTGDNTYLVLLP